jgi:hypothetical protein
MPQVEIPACRSRYFSSEHFRFRNLYPHNNRFFYGPLPTYEMPPMRDDLRTPFTKLFSGFYKLAVKTGNSEALFTECFFSSNGRKKRQALKIKRHLLKTRTPNPNIYDPMIEQDLGPDVPDKEMLLQWPPVRKETPIKRQDPLLSMVVSCFLNLL